MTEEGQKRILLVEDSLDQANLMMRWLELSGDYRITHAQDGVRGAALAQERRWDLVVTDLNLPGSDGLEVIRASKALHPDAPVLVVTAYRDQSFAAQAIREGADGFLPKPFERGELVEKAEQLLRTGGTAHHTAGPTVLAIGAHPDDVECGCGGALLRHLDLGNRVVILVLTQGEEDGTRSQRTGEAELSARLLGARVVIADLPASQVTDGEDTIQVIERVMHAFEPEIVYTHSPHDLHSDHRGAYRATLIAAREAPTLYSYSTKTSTVDFKPSLFIEVSEYVERKKEMVSLFQTADANRPYLKPSFIEACATYWGRFAGFGKVEPMEVVRGGR
ncbi:MAG: response regulator [Gemmatimonadota bacterium]